MTLTTDTRLNRVEGGLKSKIPPHLGQSRVFTSALRTAGEHWPEYLMESLELGLFMVSACTVAAVLNHPSSPAIRWINSPFLRMALTGLAMAVTLLLLIYSPWGKRSGAHLNPATTFMFYRLGKIEPPDAAFYVIFQFMGGLAGVLVAVALLGRALSHPHVNFAATQPGKLGVVPAFFAEFVISFVLATTVLWTSNHKRLSRFTPIFAASLVAVYITFEAPLSGMSMNPARTLASAVPANSFHSIWIYFTAPPLGMLIAGEFYVRIRSAREVYCAKFHHHNGERCIFRCRFLELQIH